MRFAALRTSDERAALRLALEAADLPTEDFDQAEIAVFALHGDAALVGFVGIEGRGPDRLLRSLVVVPEARVTGGGKVLVKQLEQHARTDGCKALHLLTTTAEGFFEAQGYVRMARDSAPEVIRQTREFASICPASAAYMVKSLDAGLENAA